MPDPIVWRSTATVLPPDGQLVDTFSPGGTQQSLRRQGRLWFVPDGGMYVYYTPAFWRPLEAREVA